MGRLLEKELALLSNSIGSEIALKIYGNGSW